MRSRSPAHGLLIGLLLAVAAIPAACAESAPAPTTAPPPATASIAALAASPPPPCPSSDPPIPTPAASEPAAPVASASAAPSASVSFPYTIGAATGGPAGQRPCEFRESVDTYPRTCTVKTNVDGSLVITAPGTSRNPKSGFSFKMGGGPNKFEVAGQLDAFGICSGPFMGYMLRAVDGKNVTYEARFKDHCMIVVR